MDEYDSLARFAKYTRRGIGAVIGAAAGVFGAEQIAENYSTAARVSLDVLLGTIGTIPVGTLGFLVGWKASDLVSKIIQIKEDKKE